MANSTKSAPVTVFATAADAFRATGEAVEAAANAGCVHAIAEFGRRMEKRAAKKASAPPAPASPPVTTKPVGFVKAKIRAAREAREAAVTAPPAPKGKRKAAPPAQETVAQGLLAFAADEAETSLLADSAALIEALTARVSELETENKALRMASAATKAVGPASAEVVGLKAQLKARDRQIAELRIRVEAQGAEIAELGAKLAPRVPKATATTGAPATTTTRKSRTGAATAPASSK